MTKTHQHDNKLLKEVQQLIRALKYLGGQPAMLPGLPVEKVLDNSSLFELANDIRLGRTATRNLLKRQSKSISEDVALARASQKEAGAK